MVQEYYHEYCEILKELRLDPLQSQRLVPEAESLLQQMTLEIRGLSDNDERVEWLERIQLYKNQLRLLQQEPERASLMQSSASSHVAHSSNISTESLLARQSNVLEQARRSLAETEEIAGGITENLQSQRRTMESSQNKVSALQGLTDKAHSILDNLNKPWWKKL
ncbi:hypothetical protein MPSEU_001011600 [Mayamaea pseudoterrestris]|nr:hypothetical protein MPSEU_001011600 [Mayamaea pseudoterrestris]